MFDLYQVKIAFVAMWDSIKTLWLLTDKSIEIYHASSPEKRFSVLEKTTMSLPGWCNIITWEFINVFPTYCLREEDFYIGVSQIV